MTDLQPLIAKIVPRIRELRRDLHAHPEPPFEEFETAAKVAAILETIPGVTLLRNVAVTGLVAVLDAHKTGPCVALRADMDCLPMTEETGLPHASLKPGLMHACGHDGHTAALVGAALVLARLRDELNGPVKLLFQPAEEGRGGARRMIDEGALENPRAEAVFGFHNCPFPDLALGDIALRAGAFMGGTCDFTVEVCGRGGHAATPHRTIDPIYVGAQIVNAVQSLVSRWSDPVEALVITFGSFHAGTAVNVIPESARLEGTIRSLSPALLAAAPERFARLVRDTAAAHGATATVSILPGYPVTINATTCARYVTDVARAVTGDRHLRADYAPVLAAEDFAYYQEQRPGCFYFLGTRPADLEHVPAWHHPKFDFNDNILPLAIRMHCELARRFGEFPRA